MNQQRHPNYYQLLIAQGASVVSALNMTGGAEKAKGKTWEASATLRLRGFEFKMNASFHGKMKETEETAKANLNITLIRMDVEGGRESDHKDFTRASFKALMLDDGIYVCPDYTDAISSEMRKMVNYNTNLYVGIPSHDEYQRIFTLGYKRIITW